jgi:hypothetical protein
MKHLYYVCCTKRGNDRLVRADRLHSYPLWYWLNIYGPYRKHRSRIEICKRKRYLHKVPYRRVRVRI